MILLVVVGCPISSTLAGMLCAAIYFLLPFYFGGLLVWSQLPKMHALSDKEITR